MTIHINAPTATISATTTSASVAYPISNQMFVRVLNDAANVAYFRSGSSSVVAAAGTGQFVHGNKSTVFYHDPNDTHIAVILVSGTGTVYISPCEANEQLGF
jgi:DNA-binding MurR/RpiR family transcriptional regulator